MKKIILLTIGLGSIYYYISLDSLNLYKPTKIPTENNEIRYKTDDSNMTILEIMNLERNENSKLELDKELNKLSYNSLWVSNSLKSINKDNKYIGNIYYIQFNLEDIGDLYTEIKDPGLNKIIKDTNNCSIGYSVKINTLDNKITLLVLLSDVYPWVNEYQNI